MTVLLILSTVSLCLLGIGILAKVAISESERQRQMLARKVYEWDRSIHRD